MATNSSFYVDGTNTTTGTVTSNDNTHPSTGNTAAPSSFYQNGTQYATLEAADVLQAEMDADLAAATTQANNSASSAAASASSAASAASSLATLLASGGTITPLMDGVAAVGTSTHWSHEDHVHPTDTSRAPLASPALTGTPTAPTPTAGDNSTKLATTGFVVASFAPLATPTFTYAVTINGTITADTNVLNVSATGAGWRSIVNLTNPSAANGTAVRYALSTGVANGYALMELNNNAGNPSFTLSTGSGASGGMNITTAAGPIALNPATNVTAPTPAVNDNSTKIATTAYVQGQGGAATPLMDGSAAVGTGTKWAREDHVHPTDTSRAPLASPGLTGTPTAPTPAVNDNSTKIATTAYVQGQASSTTPNMDGAAAVGTGTTWARADHVHPTDTSRLPAAMQSAGASADFNTLKTFGFYYTPDNAATNTPVASKYWYLQVYQTTASFVLQVATIYDTQPTAQYVRTFISGTTWSSWVQVGSGGGGGGGEPIAEHSFLSGL